MSLLVVCHKWCAFCSIIYSPIASKYRRRIFKSPLLKHSRTFHGPSASSSAMASSICFLKFMTVGSVRSRLVPCSCAIISIASSCRPSAAEFQRCPRDHQGFQRTCDQPPRRLWKHKGPHHLEENDHKLASDNKSPLDRSRRVGHANIEVVSDHDAKSDQVALNGDVSATALSSNEFRDPKRCGCGVEPVTPSTKAEVRCTRTWRFLPDQLTHHTIRPAIICGAPNEEACSTAPMACRIAPM